MHPTRRLHDAYSTSSRVYLERPSGRTGDSDSAVAITLRLRLNSGWVWSSGVGYSDANALVINYINEERAKVGSPPLEVSYHLRLLVRNYLAMYSEPEQSQILSDLSECGHLEPGLTVRRAYAGAYAPIPPESGDLSAWDVARIVATELLKTYGEVLLRPDWQDIGLAVRLDPVIPPVGPEVPSIMAEYLVAWRLPEFVQRPAHFPPPIDDDSCV